MIWGLSGLCVSGNNGPETEAAGISDYVFLVQTKTLLGLYRGGYATCSVFVPPDISGGTNRGV